MKHLYDPSGNLTKRAVSALLSPQITGQPVEQVATPGDIVTFSVVVDDARAVTFQWKFNGIDIPGATGDSLLLTNVSAANEGQYSVVVTNSAGSVTSALAALMLRRDPIVNTSTPPRLIVYSDDGGSVTVTPMKPSYNLGETVTLTATPFTDSVFVFASWVGDLSGSSNPRTLTLDGNKVVRARFASALLRLIAFSDAGGSVTVTPMKRGYNPGETVTLTATPFAPSVFVGWTGDLSGSSNPATLTMNGNKKIRARFAVAAPIPPGLIALWRGETDASDLIGGHHGAFFAGTAVTSPAIAAPPSITALGKVGQAFNFDGTVHVRVPDSAALKPVEQMTVEAWVFPTGPIVGTGEQVIIARGGSSLSTFNGTWKMGLRFRRPVFISHNGGRMESSVDIPLNDWTHLAITFDSLRMSKWLYINGTLVGKVTGSPATFRLGPLEYDPAPVPVTIGSDWLRSLFDPDWENHIISSPFHGRIDEVALYNRALTVDELLSIWNADFMGKDFSRPYFTSPAQLPDGVLGANYTQQVVAILGTGLLSFSLSAGALPPGMTLSSAGLVSGVPSASGTFGFTMRATDAAGAFAEQLCALQVFASVTAPAGLVGWWRAENDAQDSAGTNHGVLRNGAGFAAGRVGQAFALDGTDDCIEIPDAPALRPRFGDAGGLGRVRRNLGSAGPFHQAAGRRSIRWRLVRVMEGRWNPQRCSARWRTHCSLPPGARALVSSGLHVRRWRETTSPLH